MDLFKKLFAFMVICSILITFSCANAVTEDEEEEKEELNINRIIFTIDGTEHTFKYSSAPYNRAYGYFIPEDLSGENDIYNQYDMLGSESSADYQNQRNTLIIGFVEDKDDSHWDLVISYYITGSSDYYQFNVDNIDLNLLINRNTIGAQMTFSYAGPIQTYDTLHAITNIDCSVERKF